MYCPHCGSQLLDDTDKCPYCGNKLNIENNANNINNTNNINNSNNQTNKTSKTDTLSVVGLVLSFFTPLVALIICSIAYNRAKSNKSPTGIALAGIIISVVYMVIEVIMTIIYGTFLSFYAQMYEDILLN